MTPRALGYSIKNSDISGWDSTFAKLFVKGTSDFSSYQKNNVYILVYNVDIYVKKIANANRYANTIHDA